MTFFLKLILFSFLHSRHKNIILILVNEYKQQRVTDRSSSKAMKVKVALYISATYVTSEYFC